MTIDQVPGRGLWKEWLKARLTILVYVYFTGLAFWTVFRFAFQDRWAWLFLVSSLAVYLFLPLPLVFLTAFILRRRAIWIGLVLAFALWLALFGELFLPRLARVRASGNPGSLTAMTFNILGHNRDPQPVVAAIRASGADVVSLGELNPTVAEGLRTELADIYPHQLLVPEDGVGGAGILSRFPLQRLDEMIPAEGWVSAPLAALLDYDGKQVLLLNFHAIPLGSTGGIAGLMYSVDRREAQALAIAAFVATTEEPALVLGDLNASDQSLAYDIITRTLEDSWREAGWGLGHTFPGASSRYSSRPVILGIPAPKWMIRIDYIFHSPQWQVESAWIGPWDGFSDHRPMMARLTLAGEQG